MLVFTVLAPAMWSLSFNWAFLTFTESMNASGSTNYFIHNVQSTTFAPMAWLLHPWYKHTAHNSQSSYSLLKSAKPQNISFVISPRCKFSPFHCDWYQMWHQSFFGKESFICLLFLRCSCFEGASPKH